MRSHMRITRVLSRIPLIPLFIPAARSIELDENTKFKNFHRVRIRFLYIVLSKNEYNAKEETKSSGIWWRIDAHLAHILVRTSFTLLCTYTFYWGNDIALYSYTCVNHFKRINLRRRDDKFDNTYFPKIAKNMARRFWNSRAVSILLCTYLIISIIRSRFICTEWSRICQLTARFGYTSTFSKRKKRPCSVAFIDRTPFFCSFILCFRVSYFNKNTFVVVGTSTYRSRQNVNNFRGKILGTTFIIITRTL